MKRKKPLWLKLGMIAAALLVVVSGIWLFFEWKIDYDAETSYDEIVDLVAGAPAMTQPSTASIATSAPKAANEVEHDGINAAIAPAPAEALQIAATDTEVVSVASQATESMKATPVIEDEAQEPAPEGETQMPVLISDLEAQMPVDYQSRINFELQEPVDYQSRINFELLAQVNADVVGWIRNEGTVLDYPITQGNDNSYYLEHLFNRSQNKAGCIFLDVHNEADFSDQNSIIYGHHSRTKRMFASLTKYREKGFFEEHPVMYLYTPTCDYLVEIIAGVVVDPYASIAPFYNMTFADEETFTSYVADICSQSDFDSDVEVNPEDRLLTLSTCTYEFYDARYVVFGKMTPLPSFDGAGEEMAQASLLE